MYIKNVFVIFMLISTFGVALAQNIEFQIDKSKSNVGFKAKKMAFVGVEGRFKSYDGKVVLSLDEQSIPTIAELSGVVSVDSVDSNDETRDEHIRGEVLFDSKKYPEISFTMHRYEALDTKDSKFLGKVYGVLEAHGVKKELILDSELVKNADSSYSLGLNSKVNVKKDLKMQSYTIMSNTVTIDVNLVLRQEWYLLSLLA